MLAGHTEYTWGEALPLDLPHPGALRPLPLGNATPKPPACWGVREGVRGRGGRGVREGEGREEGGREEGASEG